MIDYNIIVKMKFGSHLYGTNTKDSDIDYKGIFLPKKEQIYLNNIPKSYFSTTKKTNKEGIKNTKNDIDEELYSLHYFIRLACEGQTVAFDMLHAPEDMIIEKSWIWNKIIYNKEKFYTKNLKAFIGYVRRQAAKYGIKGSRLNDSKRLLDYFNNFDSELKLNYIWDNLPTGEYLKYLEEKNPNNMKQYQVCGKILQEGMTIKYAKEIVNHFYKNYGKRAELAAKNKGIDWKAISHAFRAAYQVKSLLLKNTIIFPLPEADYLIKIKNGLLDYNTEVSIKLDKLMDEVEELSEKSNLPLKVNRKYWDNFIINILEETINDN